MIVINEDLLHYFRLRPACELCGTRQHYFDPHHAFERGTGGGSRLDMTWNLMAVCRPCHDQIHAGTIKRLTVLKAIAKREGLTVQTILNARKRMLQRWKYDC